MRSNMKRNLAIGATGAITIFAIGIPLFAPLALLAAGVAGVMVDRSRAERDEEDAAEESEQYSDQLHTSHIPPSARTRREPTLAEILCRTHPPPPVNCNDMLNSPGSDTDSDEDGDLDNAADEPSLRNNLYFSRRRRRM